MTLTYPPRATEPAHVTARIFVARSHETADPKAAPPAYVGKHRRPWTLRAMLATVVGGSALYMAACYFGVVYFSSAWSL